MFTGLISHMGEVSAAPESSQGGRLTIATSLRAEPGASVAVNGACLTVVENSRDALSFDVMPATLRATCLGELRPRDSVNLEPALRAGDPLGGHFVQGHVDGVATVGSVVDDGNALLVQLKIPPELDRFVIARGSVCLNGVSLTVSGRDADRITVSLIPETRMRTTFSSVRAGDRVNLEVDILARYVAQAVAHQAQPD